METFLETAIKNNMLHVHVFIFYAKKQTIRSFTLQLHYKELN